MSIRHAAAGQQAFYDRHHRNKPDLPVERLKQAARLRVLGELVRDQAFGRALVVGCGSGNDVTVPPAETVVALDLSLVGVRAARDERPSAQYLQADGTKLPFASGTFDVVMCSEVIEHIAAPECLVAEIARVLRANGCLILSIPNWISWWGLARKLGEWILRRPVTSGGQPIDNWFTLHRLQDVLTAHFTIDCWHGVWYFPPTGWGLRRLLDVDDRIGVRTAGAFGSLMWVSSTSDGASPCRVRRRQRWLSTRPL
jgi:SAM-dependent methyltransferase